MIFTSTVFASFLTILFLFYWTIFNRNLRYQNSLLLISSYIFYGWWDWKFVFLLFSISIINYTVAKYIHNNEGKKRRKLLLFLGLFINIGVLFFFKYFNFFIGSFTHFISQLGFETNHFSLHIILPLGISFYIFVSISYIIDVYQHKIANVNNFLDTLLTFSFFPTILSGPIQRPINLLPQIIHRRTFNYTQATDGLKQILWGAFMKIVIADKCAAHVNIIFADSFIYSASTLLLGIFLFTVQIYADFAGYSNMAIGIGKLFGFNIMQNFSNPYFSRDIKEFWKKWNISLTTWFRDYVFLPIAYSVSRKIKAARVCRIKTEFIIYAIGITITWVLTGLWHGANYTFIIWGLIQGILLMINHLSSKPRKKLLKLLNVRHDNILLIFVDFISTITVIMFSWIFFRAPDLTHAITYISGMFSTSIFSIPHFEGFKSTKLTTIIAIVCFFIIEWHGRKQEYAIANLVLKSRFLRWAAYYAIILAILFFKSGGEPFIYLQF